MRKLYYMGLEPYEARYTLQLQQWNEAVFQRRGIDYEVITGDFIDTSGKINTGSVLDAHGRSYYSLTQTAKLVHKMQNGEITDQDVIFYEDMFTPGFEALPYIINQSSAEYRPRVFVRCLAQTIDPDDFVNREGMFSWMRPYEKMVDNWVDGILVASEEMVANLKIAGFFAPIYVTGLPFGKSEVQSRVSAISPWEYRKKRVVFAARWDDEKQPDFYMDLAERYSDNKTEFAVLTGHDKLKSNNPILLERANKLHNDPSINFKIYEGLTKNEYYDILANSKVLFNCALQDWVSNTVSEADALGTVPLYPAYRSFPEVFSNSPNNLYVPWSLSDARAKLRAILDHGAGRDIAGRISDYQDGTIDRTIDIFNEVGDQHDRWPLDYRKHVRIPKWKI